MKLIEATDPITQAKIFFEEGVRYYAENNKDAALESFQGNHHINLQDLNQPAAGVSLDSNHLQQFVPHRLI